MTVITAFPDPSVQSVDSSGAAGAASTVATIAVLEAVVHPPLVAST